MQCLHRSSAHLLVVRMGLLSAAVELEIHHRTCQAVDMREYIHILLHDFSCLEMHYFLLTAVNIMAIIRMKLHQHRHLWAADRWTCRMPLHLRIHAIVTTSVTFKKWPQQTQVLQTAQADHLVQMHPVPHQVLPVVQAQANSKSHQNLFASFRNRTSILSLNGFWRLEKWHMLSSNLICINKVSVLSSKSSKLLTFIEDVIQSMHITFFSPFCVCEWMEKLKSTQGLFNFQLKHQLNSFTLHVLCKA